MIAISPKKSSDYDERDCRFLGRRTVRQSSPTNRYISADAATDGISDRKRLLEHGDARSGDVQKLLRPAFALGAIFAVILVLTGCSRHLEMENARICQQAQETFDQAQSEEDFRKSAGMYQKIIDDGIESGALYYNQGNAYMRAGQRGHAIAAYRQAMRYRPRDSFLQENLKFALGTDNTGLRRPLIEYVLFWQNWLSYREKFMVMAFCASVAFVLAIAALFFRRGFRTAAIVLTVVTLITVISALYDWYRFDHTRHGVVTVAEAVVRKGNAETYQPAFTQPLEEGTEFVVTGQRGSWIRIRLPGGQEGWIPQADAVQY